MTRTFDTIVIGGGSGGVAFATTAAQLGASVCLIEKDAIGGTCVNRGCVPKKLMWEATWTHERLRAACEQGLAPAPPRPDFPTLQERITEKQEDIRHSYSDSLRQAGVTTLFGTAVVTDAHTVTVGDDTYSADTLVLAIGATPKIPDFKGVEFAQTSDDVFGWTTLPRSLALLGAGYIGSEFASIFAGLGVDVHLVDPNERVLSGFDGDIAHLTAEVMRTRGVTLHLGTTPSALEKAADEMCVSLGNGTAITVDEVIVATGRAPRTELPGGFTKTLKTAGSGAFAVDDGLQTSHPGVFAVGDCADRLPLTPVATRDGETLAHRLYGPECPPLIDLSFVARAAFTMPPIAQIGQFDNVETEVDFDLIEAALTPPEHWTARTGRKVKEGSEGLLGVAALGTSAPDIVTALGAALVGSNTRAVTGIHPGAAEEFVGRD